MIGIDKPPCEKDDYNALFMFIEYLRDFDVEKKRNSFTTNCITLGVQDFKTIKQRMSFNISDSKDFISFFQTEFPDTMMKKEILMKFYNILIDIDKNFP